MPSSGGGSSAPAGTQQVVQSQQIPLFEQQYAQQNQALAQSLGSQPYPLYQGSLVAPFTPTQQAGQQGAINASTAYQPGLTAGMGVTGAATGAIDPNQAGANIAQGGNAINNALATGPATPGVIQSYMSPFVQAALAPQITALNTQLGQQQNATNAQATSENAFGDARQGSQNALNQFYGNQNLSGLLANGYNTAYNSALQTALGQQQLGVQGGQALGNLGLSQVGAGLQGGAQLANLGGLAQNLGLTGANAVYDVGQQQQQLQQQQLNTAYQQFQNQVQWPYQQLNVQESALSNSPYNIVNQTTLPQANTTAANLGAFASLAGLLGGGTGGGAQAPFGGQAYNPGAASATGGH